MACWLRLGVTIRQFRRISEAVGFWREFQTQHSHDDDESLAKAVSNAQWTHERILGERYLGKTMMPYTALSALYDEQNGFGNNRAEAVRYLKAFLASSVSLEVKSASEEAISVFGLEDYDDSLKAIVKRRLRV